MAFTVASLKQVARMNKYHVQAVVTPSTSYLTGTPSENIAPSALGLKTVEAIYLPTVDLLDPSVQLTAANLKRGFTVTLVAPTSTLVQLRFWETSGTEVADAQNKSTSPFFCVFVGT